MTGLRVEISLLTSLFAASVVLAGDPPGKSSDPAPAVRQPAAREPGAGQPGAREPAAKEPAAGQQAAREPAGKERENKDAAPGQPAAPVAKSGPLAEAEEHLARGRYEEAIEDFTELANAPETALAARLGLSRAQAAVGEYAAALEGLQAAATAHADAPEVHARVAQLLYLLGRWDEARSAVETALKLYPELPLAHLVDADLKTAVGDFEGASEAYRWFPRMYNRAQPDDAATLVIVAQGAAQYARWNGVTQIFDFVVNTVCPDALAKDSNCWEARWVAGTLLLEKYNRGQALPELKKALEINPRAADVIAALAKASLHEHSLTDAEARADSALEINPRHIEALLVKADLRLGDIDLVAMQKHVDDALAVNPVDERILARQAAIYLLTDGPGDKASMDDVFSHLEAPAEARPAVPSRFLDLVLKIAGRNPRPGRFFTDLGELLESQWRFDLAQRCLRQAMISAPQMPEPKTALALLYARVGRNADSQALLDEAIAADPYHVRVSNMRKVLKLVSTYGMIETEHFVIRYDSQADKILAKYMAEYLEEVYPELVRQFDYEPAARTQFEVFNKSKGLSGHQWFSARMVGLPWIQTIGASTGMMVAMASPAGGGQTYNWARVVKHEFIHVLTLQKTDFNIPRWYTEGIATLNEGYPRPEKWTELLRDRMSRNERFTLDTVNLGFIRPKNADDWSMAYCQSVLYAEYLVHRFGPDATAKLLAAFEQRIPAEKAVTDVFGVSKEDFESGYVAFIKADLARTTRGEVRKPLSLAELEKKYKADPKDPKTAGQFAAALIDVKKFRQARQVAVDALASDKGNPLANWAMAQLADRAGDTTGMIASLELGLSRTDPETRVLQSLGQAYLKQRKGKQARELYDLALQFEPGRVSWLKGLAAALVMERDIPRLKETLATIAATDPDDVTVRKRLASILVQEENWAEGLKYARLSLHIDVLDPEIHQLAAAAHRGLKQFDAAMEEGILAVELDPKNPEWQVDLARTELAAGKSQDAVKRLKAVLEQHPDSASAKKLISTIVTM